MAMYVIKQIENDANVYIIHRREVTQAESLPLNLCSMAANILVKNAASDISPMTNSAVISLFLKRHC